MNKKLKILKIRGRCVKLRNEHGSESWIRIANQNVENYLQENIGKETEVFIEHFTVYKPKMKTLREEIEQYIKLNGSITFAEHRHITRKWLNRKYQIRLKPKFVMHDDEFLELKEE